MNHSSLLGKFVSYEENEVLWIRPQVYNLAPSQALVGKKPKQAKFNSRAQCYKTFFFRNLQMFVIR
jgi:hypothetical protein